MDKFDTHELAWAAGFFDGEGCTNTFIEKSGRPRLAIFVGQTEPTSPERFKGAMGFGSVRGPYPPKAMRKLPWWSYGLTKFEHVQAAICLMWPWLGIPKREQAKAALRAVQEYEERREKECLQRLETCPYGHAKRVGTRVRKGKNHGRHKPCHECGLSASRRWRKEHPGYFNYAARKARAQARAAAKGVSGG